LAGYAYGIWSTVFFNVLLFSLFAFSSNALGVTVAAKVFCPFFSLLLNLNYANIAAAAMVLSSVSVVGNFLLLQCVE